MAYTRVYAFGLGSSQTGKTLAAQILDTAGGDVGSEITSIVEIGAGWYGKKVTTIPDAQEGFIKFYESGSPSTPKIVFSIAPDEGERIDAAISSASAFDATATLTESYAADGAEGSLAQLVYMIWAYIRHRERSGATITTDELDGLTPAMTFTLDSPSNPASQERAT